MKSVDLFYIDGNPSGIKEALYSLGLCSSNQVRLPLVKMNRDNAKKLNYSHTIAVIEKYYNQFNQNLNPAIGFFAMSIEMKQTIMKNSLESNYNEYE